MGNFWKIIAGRDNKHVEDFEAQGCIALGWQEIGDLSKVNTEEELARRYQEAYPQQQSRRRAAGIGCVSKFRFAMEPGDEVITYDPSTREYLWGVIKSHYRYEPGKVGQFPHLRDVEWQDRISRDKLSQSARNKLTVLITITQPSNDVYQELQAIRQGRQAPVEEEAEKPEVLVEDQIERAHELVKDRLNSLDWEQMQDMVAAVLRALGYRTQVSRAGPDRGKDVVASPDGLGLEQPRIKVQVKHHVKPTGAPDVRSFIGGLQSSDKGLFVSTAGFTKEAWYEGERSNVPVTLIDLDTLAELVVQNYEKMDTEGRALLPLVRVYWPASEGLGDHE